MPKKRARGSERMNTHGMLTVRKREREKNNNAAECQLLMVCGCEEKRALYFRIVTRTAFLLFMTHYLKVIHFFSSHAENSSQPIECRSIYPFPSALSRSCFPRIVLQSFDMIKINDSTNNARINMA